MDMDNITVGIAVREVVVAPCERCIDQTNANNLQLLEPQDQRKRHRSSIHSHNRTAIP